MNKYESFALAHYLTDFPEDMSFKEIIAEMESDTYNEDISYHCDYEDWEPMFIAGRIEDMAKELERCFGEKK